MLSVPGMDWLRPNTYKHKHYNLSNIDKLFFFFDKRMITESCQKAEMLYKGFFGLQRGGSSHNKSDNFSDNFLGN